MRPDPAHSGRRRWPVLFTAVLVLCSTFVLLDAFVIPKAVALAPDVSVSTSDAASSALPPGQVEEPAASSQSAADSAEAVRTETSYSGNGIEIQIETVRVDDTDVYIADVQLDDPSLLKTAFAQDTYGRNIKAATSDIADAHGAILAINGDYYGFRDDGYVLRNGTLYRDVARSAASDEALVIDGDGNFSIIRESEVSAKELQQAGAWQVFSFGPALVKDGQVVVDAGDEVAKAMSSNPRTAIAQLGEGHYMIVVADGRTSESEGLSLQQLAQLMAERGAVTAYNLDGGGSSTLVFNGQVLNNPAGGSGGRGNQQSTTTSERQVSDIVYIG